MKLLNAKSWNKLWPAWFILKSFSLSEFYENAVSGIYENFPFYLTSHRSILTYDSYITIIKPFKDVYNVSIIALEISKSLDDEAQKNCFLELHWFNYWQENVS